MKDIIEIKYTLADTAVKSVYDYAIDKIKYIPLKNAREDKFNKVSLVYETYKRGFRTASEAISKISDEINNKFEPDITKNGIKLFIESVNENNKFCGTDEELKEYVNTYYREFNRLKKELKISDISNEFLNLAISNTSGKYASYIIETLTYWYNKSMKAGV